MNSASTSKPVTILLVDDDEIVTRAIVNLLELETDYRTLAFQDPRVALEAARREPLDCVITDFLMPEMDGLQEVQQRRRYEQAQKRYLSEDMNNYTLSWLAQDGFFPGYALSRESVQALCLQPLLELSRPSATALRELTPANWVYADGNVFAVERLNFKKLKANDNNFSADSLREIMIYDSSSKRIYDPTRSIFEQTIGSNEREIISYQLTDVEMENYQHIDDRSETRRRVAFEIVGMIRHEHSGGEHGRIGEKEYQYLRQETVRLVNLGPLRFGPTGIQGFPICHICGETRSPQSTKEEIDRFREIHQLRCQVADISFAALHIDLVSDVLLLGAYSSLEEAINIYEGLLLGAGLILDMNQSDLEGFVVQDQHQGYWSVLYDSLPGGTGFLQQLLTYWELIIEQGINALDNCSCEQSCYKCLQHFHNQQYHPQLDRFRAADLLAELNVKPYRLHEIAPLVQKANPEKIQSKTESPAEGKFLQSLQYHHFPLPTESQFQVNLGNGNYTVADFAWVDKRVLVFIDGTSAHLHGDPGQAKHDRQKRLQAGMLGWYVIEITAQELNDQTALGLSWMPYNST